jgi:hypothetical protein
MRGLMRRTAIVAGAAVVLLGPAAGVASAAGGAVAGTRLAGAARAVSGGGWGRAEEVPGTAALNQGGGAGIESLSCASAGNCSAGGGYSDVNNLGQAMVVNEVNGRWDRAEEVRGIAALNQGRSAVINSVSCAPAGTCSAGGYYTDINGHEQAFVVNEVNGTWGSAAEVPGTAALNHGGHAVLSSVSCAPAGNCSAGGGYAKSGHAQAFVVNEVNGTWRAAEEVPGTAALNQGRSAWTNSVSCGSAGNCSAGGTYTDSSGHGQAFVVNEVNGTWGTAEEVPGTAALNQGRYAAIGSVSCGSAGNCSAGGGYTDSSGRGHAFVVNEVNGTWGAAEEVPGTAALSPTGLGWISSLSCGSAGNCSAGGDYSDSSGVGHAYVVNEVSGIWRAAEEIPGTAALNQNRATVFGTLSCGSAGNCSAGGGYTGSNGQPQVFVVNEVSGTWRAAEEVPGAAALAPNGFYFYGISALSCAPAGTCSAGGTYFDKHRQTQAFVVNRT